MREAVARRGREKTVSVPLRKGEFPPKLGQREPMTGHSGRAGLDTGTARQAEALHREYRLHKGNEVL